MLGCCYENGQVMFTVDMGGKPVTVENTDHEVFYSVISLFPKNQGLSKTLFLVMWK